MFEPSIQPSEYGEGLAVQSHEPSRREWHTPNCPSGAKAYACSAVWMAAMADRTEAEKVGVIIKEEMRHIAVLSGLLKKLQNL